MNAAARNFIYVPLLASLTILASCSTVQSQVTQEGNMKTWFTETGFKKMKISSFPSLNEKIASKQFESNDHEAIQSLVARIEKIAANGDMMKSLSEDSTYITLEFATAAGQSETIKLYERGFKTPTTGFNIAPSDEERQLAMDIRSILNARLGEKLLKVAGVTIQGDGFTITYLGHNFRKNDEPGMPTIGPTNEDSFEVTDSAGNKKKVSVWSGQTPPQDTPFNINKTTYIISTFKNSKGQQLYPGYFEVTKSKKNILLPEETPGLKPLNK